MKNPHLGQDGDAAIRKESLSQVVICPFAPECLKKWIHLVGTETADCQNFSRADMARILAGVAGGR